MLPSMENEVVSAKLLKPGVDVTFTDGLTVVYSSRLLLQIVLEADAHPDLMAEEETS